MGSILIIVNFVHIAYSCCVFFKVFDIFYDVFCQYCIANVAILYMIIFLFFT